MIAGSDTLAAGRQQFFRGNGFAADGGYEDEWADATFGPYAYSVPNTRARAAALRVHDLHHVLTGYGTDWRAEAAISAWELGSGGGGRFAYAWFVAIFGLFVGLLALPGPTWRAFVRGSASRNLFSDRDPTRWLGSTIDRVRAELRRARPRRATAIRFIAWSMLALACAPMFVLGTPLLVAAAAIRHRRCPLRPLGA